MTEQVANRPAVVSWTAARTVALVAGAVAMVYPWAHGVFPLDFHVYLAGGHAVLDGRSLYGPSVSVEGYGFTYPPFAVLPFVVLAALPLWLAKTVSILAFYVALAAVLAVCLRQPMRVLVRTWGGAALLAVLLAVNPTWANLADGQVNLALAALVLVDLARPDRSGSGRHGRGALAGVAAAVKLTPAIFVPYLVVTRQWAAARNAVLGFAVCTGLGWLVRPGDSKDYFAHELFDTSRVGDVARLSNQSLLGLATRETASGAHALWIALAIPVTVAGLWVAARLHRIGEPVLALAVVGILGCLDSPVSWTHHWVWVIPLLAGLYGSRWWTGSGARAGFAAVSVVFLLGANRIGGFSRLPGTGVFLLNSFVVVGLAAIIALAWATRGARVRRPARLPTYAG